MEVEKVNFKKLFPEKKETQKRVLDFFDKKGFYIVLTLCIAIVGVTAALITTKNISSSRNYGNDEIITDEIASNISTEDESSTSIASVPLDPERVGKTQTEDPKAISKTTPEKQGLKATVEPTKTNAVTEPKKTTEPSKSNTNSKKASTDNVEAGLRRHQNHLRQNHR